jgi:hypothetical protein
MITKEHATEMLEILTAEFKVPAVALRWRRMRGGRYHSLHRAIAMGPLGNEDTVLHEFAHHLDRMTNRRRYSRPYANNPAIRGKQGRHDVPFRAALVRVATAWYGDPARYGWTYEYAAVSTWWRQRNLGLEEGKNG